MSFYEKALSLCEREENRAEITRVWEHYNDGCSTLPETTLKMIDTVARESRDRAFQLLEELK